MELVYHFVNGIQEYINEINFLDAFETERLKFDYI